MYRNRGGVGLNTFNSTPDLVGTGWSAHSQINLAEVDGDNCSDLVARTSTGNLVVYYNRRDGHGLDTFSAGAEIIGTGWGGYSELTFGEVGGGHAGTSGFDDLLARASNGDLHLYSNRFTFGGSGVNTFSSTPEVVGTGWGHGHGKVGRLDVWAGHSASSLRMRRFLRALYRSAAAMLTVSWILRRLTTAFRSVAMTRGVLPVRIREASSPKVTSLIQ